MPWARGANYARARGGVGWSCDGSDRAAKGATKPSDDRPPRSRTVAVLHPAKPPKRGAQKRPRRTITTRGMEEDDMKKIVDFIDRVICDTGEIEAVRKEINE